MILGRLILVLAFVVGSGLPVAAQEVENDALDQSEDTVADPRSQPVDVIEPTASPAPTPGPGTILLADNFDDPTRAQLPLAPTSDTRAQGYVNGEYELINGDASTANSQEEVLVPGRQRDTSIAIDARVSGGPAQYRSAYVVCRGGAPGSGPAGYLFRVFPDRQTLLISRRQQGGPARLVQEQSAAIRPGDAVNRLELSCVGSTITASVNGTQVAAIQDATYALGNHRIGVGGTGATVRFDNLTVTQR